MIFLIHAIKHNNRPVHACCLRRSVRNTIRHRVRSHRVFVNSIINYDTFRQISFNGIIGGCTEFLVFRSFLKVNRRIAYKRQGRVDSPSAAATEILPIPITITNAKQSVTNIVNSF